MKIQLQSLRVKNCGPLDDVLIDFCDKTGTPQPVIVLGGANGSGKTTAVELCVGLLELLDKHSDTMQHPTEGLIESLIPDRSGKAQINLLIDDNPFSVGYNPDITQVPDEVDLKVFQNGGRYEWVWMGNSAIAPQLMYTIASQTDPNKQQNIEFSTMQAGNVNTVPSVLFFPHTRSLMNIQGTQIQQEETKYQWVYKYENVRSFAGSLDSYLIWLDYAEPEVYTKVIEFLNSLNFDGKTFGVHRKGLRAIVTTRDGQTHGIAKLSSGEQNILIMLLELRRRLLPHSIVLIDEIENSLHPAFQYKLAESLKRMQEQIPFQLIVTTHAIAFLEVFGEQSARILTEF